jgi:hypothetical protein
MKPFCHVPHQTASPTSLQLFVILSTRDFELNGFTWVAQAPGDHGGV